MRRVGHFRSALRSVAARLYCASSDGGAQLAGKVLILTYHRVIPRTELETTFVQPGMYVTPETFERHLRFLTDHFRILSLQDLLAMWHEGGCDPSVRYCALTFDDGWLDNHRYAYPLLRGSRVPATIFLPTDLIGTRQWLWPDRLAYLLRHPRFRGSAGIVREVLAPFTQRYPGLTGIDGGRSAEALDSLIELVKTLPDETRDQVLDSLAQASGIPVPAERRFVNWDEVREMSSHGIAFGSHTCTHSALGRLDREPLRRELQQSLEALRRERANCVPVLSYPYGDHTALVVAEARACGYHAAVTTRAGLESSQPADLFRLRRIGVHDDVSRSIPLMTFHIARHAFPARGIR